MYYGSYFIILIPGIILALYAQIKIKATYAKYEKLRNSQGISGVDAARKILDKNGLNDVKIQLISGNLTDHYNPSNKIISLSNEARDASIASISIAAHECAHAIQHETNYAPLNIRTKMVPLVSFASGASWIIIIVGLFLSMMNLSLIGVLLFSLTVLFQVLTLPVEFNASKRALVELESLGIASADDLDGASRMLSAAALTYIASLLTAILQLLRLLLIVSGNSRR